MSKVELESYFEIVDRCAENEENFVISNTDALHAAYIIKTLFKHAKNEVCIFSGQLYEGVFGNKDLQQEAINFLRKNTDCKLKIAYQADISGEDIKNGAFLKNILSDIDRKGSVEVWDASKVFPGDGHHFTVMDSKAFRFETDHETRNAIANFGDKETANKFSKLFNSISLKSNKVFSC